MELTLIMVIYNKRLTDTLTFSSIRDWKDVQVILCDNSTRDQGNEVLGGVGGERGACRVFDPLIHGQDREVARTGEAAGTEQALQAAQRCV